MGTAPASGAVFRALAENTRHAKTCDRSETVGTPKKAGREARPATPGAGVLPTSVFKLKAECARPPGAEGSEVR
jgi:hypothetical protein